MQAMRGEQRSEACGHSAIAARHASSRMRSALIGLCALILLAGCVRPPEPLRLQGQSMGTGWSVLIGDAGAEETRARPLIEAELQQVVAQMSTWEPDSDLSHFNAAAAGTLNMMSGNAPRSGSQSVMSHHVGPVARRR